MIATVTCTDNDVEPEFREYSFTSFSCTGCTQRFALTSLGSILVKQAILAYSRIGVYIVSANNLLHLLKVTCPKCFQFILVLYKSAIGFILVLAVKFKFRL